jgi:hypothetical protein
LILKINLGLGLGDDDLAASGFVEEFNVESLRGSVESVKAMLKAAVMWLDSHAPYAAAVEDLKAAVVRLDFKAHADAAAASAAASEKLFDAQKEATASEKEAP